MERSGCAALCVKQYLIVHLILLEISGAKIYTSIHCVLTDTDLWTKTLGVGGSITALLASRLKQKLHLLHILLILPVVLVPQKYAQRTIFHNVFFLTSRNLSESCRDDGPRRKRATGRSDRARRDAHNLLGYGPSRRHRT